MSNQQPQYNKEMVLQAIQIFLAPNNQEQKDQFKQAETFLIGFERSKLAWPIIAELLLQDNLSESVYSVLAKKLKSKLEYDFGQLEEKDKPQLMQIIVTIIYKHKNTEARAIRSSLSLCFIYCYMHNFEQDPKIIQLMQKYFSSDPAFFSYIIQILQCLPAEINSETLVIDNDLLDKIYSYYKSNLQQEIIVELNTIGKLTTLTQQQKYQLLKCFNDWINIEKNDQLINTMLGHSLFQMALTSLDIPELREDSAEIIVSILSQIDLRNEVQSQFIKQFTENINKYFTEYKSQQEQENFEEALQYLKIISEFGIIIMDELISNINQYSIQFFNNFLLVSSDNFSESAMYQTNFWSCFVKRVALKENKQQIIELFSNLISELIKLCQKKSRLELEQYESLVKDHSEDEYKKIKDQYEEKIRERHEFVYLISKILKVANLAQIIMAIHQQIVQCFPQSKSDQPLLPSQEMDLESTMYLVYHLIDNIQAMARKNEDNNDNKENNKQAQQIYELSDLDKNILSQLISQLLSLQLKTYPLQKYFLKLLSKSAKYLKEFTEIQKQAFQYNVQCLNNKRLFKFASHCFESMCHRYPEFVISHIQDFLKLYEQFYENEKIICGLSEAICSKNELVEKYFLDLWKPLVLKLIGYSQTLQNHQSRAEELINAKNDIPKLFNRMTVIIQSVPPIPDPEDSESKSQETDDESVNEFPYQLIVNILKELWNVIVIILEYYTQEYNDDIVEKTCRFIKHTMRCIQKEFIPFLQPYLSAVVKLYSQKQISTYLYAIEVTITVFYKNPEQEQIIQNSFNSLCTTTFQNFQSIQQFEEYPDIIEDFFGMQQRIIKFSRKLFLQSHLLQQIFLFALEGIGIQHTQAAKSLYHFIEYVYYQVKQSSIDAETANKQILIQLQEYMKQQTPVILIKLFKVLESVPTSSVRDYIYDILLAIMNTFPNFVKDWFTQILSQLAESILTFSEKEKFIKICQQVYADNSQEDEMLNILQLLGRRFKKEMHREKK